MKTSEITLHEIRQKGLRVLAAELGPVGMVRFLQQYETGSGDYSKERRAKLGQLRARDIAAQLKKRRQRTAK